MDCMPNKSKDSAEPYAHDAASRKKNMCLRCNEATVTCYLFLVGGIFCKRTQGVVAENYQVVDKQGKAIVGRHLTFCYDCAITEACVNTNVAGYLTVQQYGKYRKDANRSFKFRTDGYIVLKTCEWRDWGLFQFNAQTLKYVLESSPSNCKKRLPNGAERTSKRRWAELEISVLNKEWLPKTDADLCMDNIIHADVHWGKKAVMNVIADFHREIKEDNRDQTVDGFEVLEKEGSTIKPIVDGFEVLKKEGSTIKPMHYAPLWRLNGIREIQKAHGDSGPGNYHAVVPFTSDYEIIVHPGTHLLHESYDDAKEDKYYVTPTTAKWLKLQLGELLLFHANIAHCGGRSSKKGKKANEKRFQESEINIDWFGSTKKSEGTKLEVTDLAMHYGLENCLFKKSIECDYRTNAIEQLRVSEETQYKIEGTTWVPNKDYARNEKSLKEKLREAKSTLDNYSQGKPVSKDYVFPEVFHFVNEANMALKKYRDHLIIKFGDRFKMDVNPIHNRRSGRKTREPKTFDPAGGPANQNKSPARKRSWEETPGKRKKG